MKAIMMNYPLIHGGYWWMAVFKFDDHHYYELIVVTRGFEIILYCNTCIFGMALVYFGPLRAANWSPRILSKGERIDQLASSHMVSYS